MTCAAKWLEKLHFGPIGAGAAGMAEVLAAKLRDQVEVNQVATNRKKHVAGRVADVLSTEPTLPTTLAKVGGQALTKKELATKATERKLAEYYIEARATRTGVIYRGSATRSTWHGPKSSYKDIWEVSHQTRALRSW